MEKKYSFDDFREIVDALRSEQGCPWDKAQTHESLRSCMVEEAYEAVSAINRRDEENLCEELGDVLLQVVLHSRIAQEEGSFTLDDVVQGISEKMIRRHPHVFGDGGEDMPGWEEIKRREHEGKVSRGLFGDIPEEFPALIRAQKVMKKAAGECAELREEEASLEKIQGLAGRLKKAQNAGETGGTEEIITSMLLYCVNFLRLKGIHAEQVLNDRLDEIVKNGANTAKNLDKYM